MRIYTEPSDQLLTEINRAVKEKGSGKTQMFLWLLISIYMMVIGELSGVSFELDKVKSLALKHLRKSQKKGWWQFCK